MAFHTELIDCVMTVSDSSMLSQLLTIAFLLKSMIEIFFKMRMLMSISILAFRLLMICISLMIIASQSLLLGR